MDEITIGGLPAGENPNDADLFEVEQGGQSVRLTFEQLKVAIREGRLENIEGLFAAGDNVEITGSGTAEDPYIISATGGGGGGIPDAPDDGNLYGRKDGEWEEVPEAEGFDISGLPVAATLQNSDYLPVSQSAAPSVRFWRLTVLSNTENNTHGQRNRLYEMQLREIVGIPQTAEPATVTGTGWWSSGYPAGNAVDGSTSTYSAGSQTHHAPYTVMFEYPEPVAILELAIFYPSASTGREYSPGNFRLEYSEDGSIWNTALEVSGYSSPPVGWNTWGLFGDPVQRRAPLQQLREFLGGQEGSLDNIEGLIEAGDNVTLTGTGTAEDPFVINASGAGAVGDLDPVPSLAGSDAFAVLQSDMPAARFWRLTVLDDLTGFSGSGTHRVQEIEFREAAGVPQPVSGAAVYGSYQNPELATDGDTDTAAGTEFVKLPQYLRLEYPEAKSFLEFAIYYPSDTVPRNRSPGTFRVEYSIDGTLWYEALFVENFPNPGAAGWQSWSLVSDPVYRRATLQQIREFMGPEAATPQQIRDGAEPLFVATDALRDSKHFREVTAGSADTTLPLDEHINIDLIVSTDTTVDTVGQPAQAGKGVNVLLRGDSPTVHTVTWGSNVLNVDPPVIDNLTDTLGWIVSGIVSPDGRFMITSANEVNL